MIATFESILPIFLMIVLGVVMRRIRVIDQSVWPGLQQIAYWFLYPALLFSTIYNADFSGLRLDTMLVALLVAFFAMAGLVMALWPLLRAAGLAARPEFSSIFQTALRWNGFMALAIAQEIFPPAGSAVVALVMAVIILPVNALSILVVMRFSGRPSGGLRLIGAIAINPLILGSVLAVAARMLPFPLYGPINDTLVLAGSAALGMGLFIIGAGLDVADLARLRLAMWLPVALKLAVFPLILVTLAWAMGLDSQQLQYLALCAAVPTAMNGFLLARQYGGDAELYAAVTTLQTTVAFFSIPAVLALTAQFTSG